MTALSKEEEESDEEERDLVEALDDIVSHKIYVNDDKTSSDSEQDNFSHMATIHDTRSFASFIACLQDAAFEHVVTTDKPQRFGNVFQGIIVDTGAAKGSTAGRSQYKAYCTTTCQDPKLDSSRAVRCHFGIGSATSSGVAIILFPIGQLWFSFEAHIVDADVPILLCIDNMDSPGIYLDNLRNLLIHPASNQNAVVTRTNGHPFVHWNAHLKCMLTSVELRRLHRRFGHPSTYKLINLLERSEIQHLGPETRKILKGIKRTCDPCQSYAQKPRRFKFTLRDDKDFNHTIYADIFYIEVKPVLHIVDEATYFQATRWLENVTSDTLWRALRLYWIYVYVGPPVIIAHDAGKNFMGAVFQSNADMLHIRTKSIPVEAAHSMSIVERYHGPLRRGFQIIRREAPDTDKDAALQMAVKAVNDPVGPNGLIPTLLVFGALPHLGLPTDAPSPSTFKRAVVLRKARTEVQKLFASRKVRNALKSRNGPDVTDILMTPIGSLVLVYRPEKDQWEGPFSVLEIRDKDVIVLTPKGAVKFRSTVVKPYLLATDLEIGGQGAVPESNGPTSNTSYTVSHSDNTNYETARKEEESFASVYVKPENTQSPDTARFSISRMQ